MSFLNIDEEFTSFAYEEATLMGYYIDFQIAMEADASIDDKSKSKDESRKFMTVVGEKIQKIITEIIAIIDRMVSKLKNIFRRILQTDKGFDDQIREAMKSKKPLEGIKLVAYEYNTTGLDKIELAIANAIFKMISSLKVADYTVEKNDENEHDLDKQKSSLYQKVFQDANLPDSITDINMLYDYMKKSYRKNKKETLFTSSNAKKYYEVTKSYKRLQDYMNEKERVMRQQVSVLRTNITNVTKNSQTPVKIKKRGMKQAKNASLLYNLYATILSMYIELKTEEILTYRIVLRKLYGL